MGIFKKLITLAGVYIAGNVAYSLSNKEKRENLKNIKKENGNILKFLLDDFIENQKNIAKNLKENCNSEKVKNLFIQKKEELLELSKKYKQEVEKAIIALKGKGNDKFKNIFEKIEEIYEQQKEKIKELKNIAPEKADEFKKTLLKKAKEIKNELAQKI